MKQTEATTMTHYLLGKLPETERDVYEQQWFVDKAQFAQFCEAENALIDAYVRGNLAAEDRALFEQKFLTMPARRERVQAARVLMYEIDRQPVTPETISFRQRLLAFFRFPQLIPGLALASCLLLAAFGVWWFASTNQRLRGQLEQANANASEQQRRLQELETSLTNERAANARLQEGLTARQTASPTASPIISPTASPAVPSTLLFTLPAGVLRGEGSEARRSLKIVKGIERVQLHVPLPEHEFAKFAVSLRTADGKEIMHWSSIKSPSTKRGASSLWLFVPAKLLNAGDFVLILNGINAQRQSEEFRRLSFTVTQ